MISKSLTNRVFQSIDQFLIEKYTQPLGVGSFGTVRLGTHKYTNKTYAIKIICADKDFKQNQLSLLQRQISIHYTLNHPHIVKLWDVLQQPQKIYMVMEYAHKGNLFNFQSTYKQFSEVESFKLFIQVLDAIEYLHKNNIFHRDIKPENILLDHQMNTKLCDFGWAAPDINRKRSTFCGTYEYMAPEMINEQDYDFKIDVWALGVLLYQLIHAAAPFPAETFDEVKERISAGSYEINVNISLELKNLIMSILQFDPKDRPTLLEIKKNPWILKMKKQSQVRNAEHKFDKKKGKNAYGSLDFTPSKHQASKFGSMLFQDSTNKKQSKSKIVMTNEIKKRMKKKCKTLEQQNIQKLVRPLKNMLTLYNQKQNDEKQDGYASTQNLLKVKNRFKMLNKMTLTNNQFRSGSKLTQNPKTKQNDYFQDCLMNSQLKNFKKVEKLDTEAQQLTSRNMKTAEVKKKKKKVV